LRLTNAHGDVVIEGTETDRITLTLEKKIWRHDEAEAKAVADQLHPRVTKTDAAVILSTNRDEFKRRNFETNFRLTVPAAMAVEVENSYGLLHAQQLSSAVITNSHGEVTVSNVSGEVKIDNSYENVNVEGVRARCAITSRHSDISARQIEGELQVGHQYGLVKLQNISQKVTVDGPHTEIFAEDISGPVDIRNSYEKVTLRRVGQAKVQGHHSDVEAEEVNGNAEFTSSYASISAVKIHGGLRVTGRSLSLSGKSITGGEIYISTNYEPVELTDFAGKTTILVSHGDVALTPLPLTGPLEVRCDYSPITLYWPDAGQYPFEAQTKTWEIHWRLPEQVTVEEKDGRQEVKAFLEAKDKPGILLVTSYENIQIEKAPSR
jgi:hypothetical protein